MSSTANNLLGSVDQRTQLAGHNRMELLIFHLGPRMQPFAINVFKVRGVVHCPALSEVPNSAPNILGITDVRGEAIPVVNLGGAVGMSGGSIGENPEGKLMILTEYNQRTQAFVVDAVDRIVNMSWGDIKQPPANINAHYLTATCNVKDKLVGLLDVERVLAEINPDIPEEMSRGVAAETSAWRDANKEDARPVYIVDDSAVARRQLTTCLESMGFEVVEFKNGQEVIDKFERMIAKGDAITEHVRLLVSDLEMPEVDGYTLTKAMKGRAETKGLPVILHSSLSGGFNRPLVKQVGADDFVSKFDPDELAQTIMKHAPV